MKNLKWIATLFTVAILTACGNEATTNVDSNEAVIEGNIEGAEQIFLAEINTNGQKPLDTIPLTDGKFEYRFKLDTANFYHLSTSPRSAIALFVTPGEAISVDIKGEAEDLTYTVEGSKESGRIKSIYDLMQDASKRRDSLDQVASTYADSANFREISAQLTQTFQTIIEDARNKAKDLIDSDPGNITNIFIFPLSIGRVPLIPAQEDFDYFEKTASAIVEQNPGNPHAIAFVTRVEEFKKSLAAQEEMDRVQQSLVPGVPVPDIALSDPYGNTRKLSDLKGKIVLVDFWAQWCRPCRAANPELVRIYNAYKDKGFEIFSVSLDGVPNQPNPKEAWIGAIQQDGLVWENHVSDLQGWNSNVVKTFGFSGIPYTVLVDREGKIITTNLQGAALEQQLKISLSNS